MATATTTGGFLLTHQEQMDLVKMHNDGGKPTCFLEGLDDGQSTDKNHSGQIELSVVLQQHGQQDVTGFSSGLDEGSVGRATTDAVVCVATFNNSSPKIAQLAASGENVTKDLKIHYAVASPEGAKDYGVVELPNPSIISYSSIVNHGKGKAVHIFAIGPSQTKWKHGSKETSFNWQTNSK